MLDVSKLKSVSEYLMIRPSKFCSKYLLMSGKIDVRNDAKILRWMTKMALFPYGTVSER